MPYARLGLLGKLGLSVNAYVGFTPPVKTLFITFLLPVCINVLESHVGVIDKQLTAESEIIRHRKIKIRLL